MRRRHVTSSRLVASAGAIVASFAVGQHDGFAQMITRTENFNVDPNWDFRNNRATTPPAQQVTQNFGWKNTSNAGGTTGEVGGFIWPVGEQAYYGKVLSPLTFNDSLTVTGDLKVEYGGNVELGFFNNTTVNEWRTPNTVAFRLYGRGSYFLAYPEYGTSKWRAGAGGGDFNFATNVTHPFSLTYNPNGNAGGGTITGTIGGVTRVVNLSPGHKADGATFNRFGFLNISKSWDGPGNFWIDNVNINGVAHNFASDPGWEGLNNNVTYMTTNVRPRFDFGYSGATNHAGGAAPGEMGGHTFRGDSRSQFNGSLMAYYGDELDQTLTMNQPLVASGKISFNRGVSDSTTLIGFFHDAHSNQNDEQGRGRDFLGAVIEGPSSEGFLFYPGYQTDQLGVAAQSRGNDLPYIYPNGDSRDWSLRYDPNANGGNGRIHLSLDGQEGYLDLAPGHKNIGAHFNRFGIVTTHIDGNGQTVWLDDLTYTVGFGAQQQWLPDASGDWHDASNWALTKPNAAGAVALFANNNTAGRTVFANAPVKVGTINFNSPHSWLLAGLGTLTLEGSGGSSAQVHVAQGTHHINVPLILASNTQLNVAAGATLVVSDPVTIGAGKTVTQTGPGTVTYRSTVTMAGGASLVLAGSTELAAMAIAPEAKADVGGDVVVHDGDYAAIRAEVARGFNGGDWRGKGVTSTLAADDKNHATAVGVVGNAQLRVATFCSFSGLDDDAVLIKYTYYGDADLSGDVDLDDFIRFVAGYDGGGDDWLEGDFDYSGGVDVADFDRFLLGFRHQPDRRVTGELVSAIQAFAVTHKVSVDWTAIPEPSSAATCGLAAAALGRRRRSSTPCICCSPAILHQRLHTEGGCRA